MKMSQVANRIRSAYKRKGGDDKQEKNGPFQKCSAFLMLWDLKILKIS